MTSHARTNKLILLTINAATCLLALWGTHHFGGLAFPTLGLAAFAIELWLLRNLYLDADFSHRVRETVDLMSLPNCTSLLKHYANDCLGHLTPFQHAVRAEILRRYPTLAKEL